MTHTVPFPHPHLTFADPLLAKAKERASFQQEQKEALRRRAQIRTGLEVHHMPRDMHVWSVWPAVRSLLGCPCHNDQEVCTESAAVDDAPTEHETSKQLEQECLHLTSNYIYPSPSATLCDSSAGSYRATNRRFKRQRSKWHSRSCGRPRSCEAPRSPERKRRRW